MWALVESNNVTKVYTRPKAITIGDVSYPQNIFMLWSSSELEAIGIYEVVVDNSNYKNPEYYINTNQTFAFANGTVKASYGTATAKNLADLKTSHCGIVDNEAYNLLQPNDWMVVKATETSGTVASDWTTYRSGVRSTAADMQSKINAVTTVDALAALYVYNDAEPPVRPLGEWPTPPEE